VKTTKPVTMYRRDGTPYQTEGKFWNGYRFDHFHGRSFKSLEMEEQAFIRKLVHYGCARLEPALPLSQRDTTVTIL
jgi:hypothetical protein